LIKKKMKELQALKKVWSITKKKILQCFLKTEVLT